jgi:hypothetical protein
MNRSKALLAKAACVSTLAAAIFSSSTFFASGQSVQHLTVTIPGGMPGLPMVTGLGWDSNRVTVTWDGPAGYYQLFQKDDLVDPTWEPIGGRTNLTRRATVVTSNSNALFRVYGPAARYAGARACEECHQATHDSEMGTRHAQALETLKEINQGENPSCLPCHTVGFGLPTGYTNEITTAHLAGVQCENCHGPGANHAANPEDRSVVPRVELASTACGGCHTTPHHPTYDEWQSSAHAFVTEDMNPTNRITSCGKCHSGTVRDSLVNHRPLPKGDANMGITCANCHDPHSTTGNPAQLRNPVASMHDFSLSTSDVFATKYDPTINVCAQCHNHRGASWTSSSRPPHHSPQYNMLIGTIGEQPSGAKPNAPAAHAFLEKQCVTCHMQTKGFTSEEQPAVTGHSFRVELYDTCLDCHPYPELLVQFTTISAIPIQVDEVKRALDLWVTTKAPEALRAKYGARAWEYTNPGELSVGGPGPNSTEQALIPDNIKKARFNLYVVVNDGSYGVHNGPHSVALLETALAWVRQELNK